MENKILVELKVPILEDVYNVFIPVSKTVAEVTELLEKSVIELSGGAYEKCETVGLYDVLGKQIEPDIIVKNSTITNGSTIILI